MDGVTALSLAHRGTSAREGFDPPATPSATVDTGTSAREGFDAMGWWLVSTLEPHAREPEDDVLVDVLDMVSEPLEVATDA